LFSTRAFWSLVLIHFLISWKPATSLDVLGGNASVLSAKSLTDLSWALLIIVPSVNGILLLLPLVIIGRNNTSRSGDRRDNRSFFHSSGLNLRFLIILFYLSENKKTSYQQNNDCTDNKFSVFLVLTNSSNLFLSSLAKKSFNFFI
jgi:hypothetical protein